MPNMLPSSKDLPPIQFSTGQVVATPGALRLLAQHGISPHQLVSRHVRCDYGSVPAEDAAANNDALIHGGRVLSSFPVGGGHVWVITEWDHALTSLILPTDY